MTSRSFLLAFPDHWPLGDIGTWFPVSRVLPESCCCQILLTSSRSSGKGRGFVESAEQLDGWEKCLCYPKAAFAWFDPVFFWSGALN
jgi:hypothetical protein